MSRMSRVLSAGAAALLVVGLVGCSSDSNGSAATPAASTPAASATASTLCADADAVRASLDTLTSTELLKDGTNALKANVTALETSVTTLLASAKTDFAAEAEAARTSVEALKTAVGNLTDSPSVADAAAVAASLKPVQESVSALVTAVKSAC